MPSITIRHVPEETRNELAARAARAGQSLQEYLRGALITMADKPDIATLMRRIEERKRRERSDVTPELILAWRDEDRP